MSIITTDLVAIDVDAGGDKEAVISLLAARLADAGRSSDGAGLVAAAMAREAQSATGLPGGIAIPHCRSPYVDQATIGFARLSPPVDFGAPDGPADLAFLIAAPDSGGAEHMKLLSSLARALVRKEFLQIRRDPSSYLIAGLLPRDHGKRVVLVDERLSPFQLQRGIDLSVAPITRPETWALLRDTTPETVGVLAGVRTGVEEEQGTSSNGHFVLSDSWREREDQNDVAV